MIKIYNKEKKLSWKIKSLFIIGMATVSSCNPLGIEPMDQVNEGQFWTNPQLARSYVNRFYLWSPKTANESFTAEMWSDNAIGNSWQDYDTQKQIDFYKRNYDPLKTISCFKVEDLWDDLYKNIRAVNLGMEKLPIVPGLNDSKLKQMLGECYFFRAWLYFELQSYWGTVPFVGHTMSVMEESMLPRLSREALFDQMLKDLDQSITYFTESGVTPELGYTNLNAAETFKSRVALYAGCAAEAADKGLYDALSGEEATKKLFRFTKTPESYYQIALTASGNVLGKYSLDDYQNLFNSVAGHKSPEAIWPMMFKDASRGGFNPALRNGPYGFYYERGGTQEWGITGSAFPTQDLVDGYYQKDAADGVWKQWWKTKQAADMNVSYDQATGLMTGESADYGVLFKNRDKRFYATVVYDSCLYAGNLVRTWIDNTTPVGTALKYSALHTGFRYTEQLGEVTGRASCATMTGYYPKKYMQEKQSGDGSLNTTQPTTSYFMIRYAEVLLNYAEAAIKLNSPEKALPKINDIRHRAGLDDFNAAVVGHDLWDEYKLQRRLEFAYEIPAQRYYDLLRWSEAEGKSTIEEINRDPKVLMIFMKGMESDKYGELGYPVPSSDPSYFIPKVETRYLGFNNYKKVFDNARYYFVPFLQTKLESYRGLTQNPGW